MPMPTSKETSTFGYHYDDHDLEMNSMPPAPNKPLLDEEEEETIEKPIQFENPDSINYHETLEEDEYDDENEERIVQPQKDWKSVLKKVFVILIIIALIIMLIVTLILIIKPYLQ